MRKNYFRQSLKAAVVLLTATMVMNSCGTQDNPIEEVINSTSTSSDYTLTSTGAIITATTPAGVSAALQELISDIQAKGVGEGNEYVIEVSSSIFNTIAEQNITVPEIAGATINIVIKDPFTQPTTVVIGDNAPAATRGIARTRAEEEEEATDKMFITLPDVANGIIPTFQFTRPNTEIIMLAANDNSAFNLKDVNGDSNFGTFYLGHGVKVDTYKYTQRKASESFRIRTSYLGYFDEETGISREVSLWWGVDGQNFAVGDDIILDNMEIMPTDVVVNLSGYAPEKRLTIADGVTVKKVNGVADAGELLESKGNSTLLVKMRESEMLPTTVGAKQIKGITFTPDESVEQSRIGSSYADIENCTFNLDKVTFGSGTEWPVGTDEPLVKNTKFVSSSAEPGIEINAKGKATGTFDFTFDGCEFSDGTKFKVNFATKTEKLDANRDVVYDLSYGYYELVEDAVDAETGEPLSPCFVFRGAANINDIPELRRNEGEKATFEEFQRTHEGYYVYKNAVLEDVTYSDFIVRIIFTNGCTYGGSAITNSTAFVAASSDIPGGAQLYYNIDGIDYKVNAGGSLTAVGE